MSNNDLVTSPFTVKRIVRINKRNRDGAIDQEKSNLVAYALDRDSVNLVFNEGQEPIWFCIEPLPFRILMNLQAKFDAMNGDLIMAAVLWGCHRVELPGGQSLEAPRPPQQKTGDIWCAQDAWLETLRGKFGASTVHELGQAILDISDLKENQKPVFTLWAGLGLFS